MAASINTTLVTINIYPYIFAKFTVDKPAICSQEPFIIDRTASLGAINHYFWTYQNLDGPNGENLRSRIQLYLYK